MASRCPQISSSVAPVSAVGCRCSGYISRLTGKFGSFIRCILVVTQSERRHGQLNFWYPGTEETASIGVKDLVGIVVGISDECWCHTQPDRDYTATVIITPMLPLNGAVYVVDSQSLIQGLYPSK